MTSRLLPEGTLSVLPYSEWKQESSHSSNSFFFKYLLSDNNPNGEFRPCHALTLNPSGAFEIPSRCCLISFDSLIGLPTSEVTEEFKRIEAEQRLLDSLPCVKKKPGTTSATSVATTPNICSYN